MTLCKAVEILIDLLDTSPQFPPDDRRNAVVLAIEALKQIQLDRGNRLPASVIPLPGETWAPFTTPEASFNPERF